MQNIRKKNLSQKRYSPRWQEKDSRAITRSKTRGLDLGLQTKEVVVPREDSESIVYRATTELPELNHGKIMRLV